jgi:hypothetical protein
LRSSSDDGIVVEGSGRRQTYGRQLHAIGPREGLGNEAAAGLALWFTDVGKEWKADVMESLSDRFERRLVEETARLRGDIAGLRQEMTTGFSELRQELTRGLSDVRHEMADQRFELLKWAFLFWVGQFFAVAGLIAVLVRFLRPGP